MGFVELEKPYDRVSREALWQVLIIYDVGIKLLNSIMRIYAYGLECMRVKRGGNKF